MKFSRENHLGNNEIATSDHRQDYFDQLPDPLLVLIFNKILDAKTLVRCLAVSKRFNSLISQTDAVFLPLPPQKNKPTKLVRSFLRFLHKIVSKKPRNAHRNVFYHSPCEVLKGFNELKSLHLELPRCKGEMGFAGKDSLLKWKAEFGSNLSNCVILGANSLKKEKIAKNDNLAKENDNQNALSDDDLKLRIVWMISCLIAASARHYLLKRVVSDFPTLTNVVVSDGDRRGKVLIGGEELAELRSESVSGDSSDVALESSLERSLIPDLGMKMWYVPMMVLPTCGWVLEGATLVVIKPLDRGVMGKGSDGCDCDLLVGGGGFDGDEEEREILDEAVRQMVKMKKTYVMEMTSF